MAVRVRNHNRNRRQVTHQGLDTQMRDYQAAMVDNLTASWKGTYLTSPQLIFRSWQMLVSRSRQQVENNDYARFFMTLLKTNVVGPNGFDFQARVVDPNETLDVMANKAIDKSFRDWMKPIHADHAGRSSFVELQRLFIASVATDGEVLCRIRKGRKYGKYEFALEFIDPGFLDINYNNMVGNNIVEMGIEYDQDNRAVAYHIIKTPRGQLQSLSAGYMQTGVRERIPASEIIHCFLTERVGQPRGLPWMSTALLRMNMQGGFEEAALVNARAGAGKMGFLEETSDLTQVFDKDDDTGEIIDQSDPGSWHRLPPGVKIAEYDPTYPNNEFASFSKAILRGIAAGLGVAYHTLANDLEGVNYSSGRLGSQNERDVWTVLQNWMVESFMRPVYIAWMDHQLATGSIRVGAGSLRASQAEKYMEVEFQGRRWSGVDPKKEEDANQTAYDMRTKSLSQIIREKAQDPDKVWAEIAEDNRKMEELGIEPAPPKPAAPGDNSDENSVEKDGKQE